MLGALIWAQARQPFRWLKALVMTNNMARRSERGFLRHLAYLLEAAILLKVVLRQRIQHLHVHFGTNAAAVARLMRCLGGPPYSFTVHGPDEFDAPRSFALADKIADAAFVVAISDFCSAQLRRWADPTQWNKIHVVRCTVGEDFFIPIAPSTNSSSLLCVGRLSPQKGQFVLLDAVKRLVDDGIGVRLVLAGDGELRALLEAKIQELNLEQHVQITGWIDENTVREQLVAARVLVQPSFAEGLPVVIMESLAMGRPVISTMIAGIPELVQHGVNGWLVPAGNLDQLVFAMQTALSASPDELGRMGCAGQRAVRERHFTSTEVDKLEQLFSDAVNHSEAH
jgi:colanic acid/amylovoran biosynthesis glycosyltransferase